MGSRSSGSRMQNKWISCPRPVDGEKPELWSWLRNFGQKGKGWFTYAWDQVSQSCERYGRRGRPVITSEAFWEDARNQISLEFSFRFILILFSQKPWKEKIGGQLQRVDPSFPRTLIFYYFYIYLVWISPNTSGIRRTLESRPTNLRTLNQTL